MSRLVWDAAGEKYFETGTKMGVLYVQDPATGNYGTGIAWNGLTGFTESPTGAEPNKMYADDILYANLRSAEELEGSLTAYTYPDEFAECLFFLHVASILSAKIHKNKVKAKKKRLFFCFSLRFTVFLQANKCL